MVFAPWAIQTRRSTIASSIANRQTGTVPSSWKDSWSSQPRPVDRAVHELVGIERHRPAGQRHPLHEAADEHPPPDGRLVAATSQPW